MIGIKYVFSFLFIGGLSGKMVRSFYMQKKSAILSDSGPRKKNYLLNVFSLVNYS